MNYGLKTQVNGFKIFGFAFNSSFIIHHSKFLNEISQEILF